MIRKKIATYYYFSSYSIEYQAFAIKIIIRK